MYLPSRGTNCSASTLTDSSGRGGRVLPSGCSSPIEPAPRKSVTKTKRSPFHVNRIGQLVSLLLICWMRTSWQAGTSLSLDDVVRPAQADDIGLRMTCQAQNDG